MASEPQPAIDLEHLGTYTQGDRALELELLTMLLPSAQGYVDAMAAHSGAAHSGAAQSGEAWWAAAHALKGVALGVGAKELAALAEAAEALQDADGEIRGQQVMALQAALERVRRFVADLD